MAEGSEYQALPGDNRYQDKIWKANLGVYEDAAKTVGSIADLKGPDLQNSAPLNKSYVADSDAVSQVKAPAGIFSPAANAHLANRVCRNVLKGLVGKCIIPEKEKKTHESAQICMYVEIAKQVAAYHIQATNLDAILEDETASLDVNPHIKRGVSSARVLFNCTPSVFDEEMIKTLSTYDLAAGEDSSASPGMAVKVVGERVMTPYFGDMDNGEIENPEVGCEKAEVVAAVPAKRESAGATASLANSSVKNKPETQTRALRMASTDITKPPDVHSLGRPAELAEPLLVLSKTARKANAVAATVKILPEGNAPSKPVFSQVAPSDEQVKDDAGALFPEESLTAHGERKLEGPLGCSGEYLSCH